MTNNNLEFLDVLSIISFSLQMQNLALQRKQATNNDILRDLHADLEVVNEKLNKLLASMDKEKPLP